MSYNKILGEKKTSWEYILPELYLSQFKFELPPLEDKSGRSFSPGEAKYQNDKLYCSRAEEIQLIPEVFKNCGKAIPI